MRLPSDICIIFAEFGSSVEQLTPLSTARGYRSQIIDMLSSLVNYQDSIECLLLCFTSGCNRLLNISSRSGSICSGGEAAFEWPFKE